jgi:uncharacterized membrane protein YesL
MNDNSIKAFFRTVTDVILLNLLWIFASFLGLLVTTGASTTAMFRVIFQLFKQEEPTNVLEIFIKSFKENFVSSTLVWIGLVILSVPTYYMYITSLNNENTILLLFSVVCAYQILIFTIYFFPIHARFKTSSMLHLIKNVILLSNVSLWTNIKVLGSLLAVILLMIYINPMFVLIIIALYGVMIVFHIHPILKPFVEQYENSDREDVDHGIFKI